MRAVHSPLTHGAVHFIPGFSRASRIRSAEALAAPPRGGGVEAHPHPE